MVCEPIYTMETTQAPQAVCRRGLGICLEGLTDADVDRLYAMVVLWRRHLTPPSCSPATDRHPTGVHQSSNVPLVSIGPSGLGGHYQTEI